MQLSSPKSSPKAFLSTHFVLHSASKSISVISTFYLVQWPPCFVPTGSELFITLPELDCYDFIDGLQSQSVLILSDTFINLQFLVAQEFVFFHGDFLRVCHPTVLCSFSLLAQGHCGETAVLNFWISGAILVFSDNNIPVQGRKVQSTGIEPAGNQWGISLVNCCRRWQWPSLGRVLDCVWVEKRSWENKQ